MPILDNPFEKIKLAPGFPEMPPIGIGTWAWGNGLYWSFGSSKIDEEDLKRAYQFCLKSGILLFDTAEAYNLGRSEKTLGSLRNSFKQPIVIATKLFPYPWRKSRSFRRALKGSLRRLGVEAIDLYQMHWPLPGVSIEAWMNLMADAVNDGLIKAVGVSNYDREQTKLAYETLDRRGIKLASNQIVFNLTQRQNIDNGLLDLCRSLNVKVIAYSPLAQGVLTGKFGADNPPPGIRGFRITNIDKFQPLINGLHAIAGSRHCTPAQVALNWALCKGTIPIPGIKSLAQAKDNLQALTWRLDDNEIQELDKLSLATQ